MAPWMASARAVVWVYLSCTLLCTGLPILPAKTQYDGHTVAELAAEIEALRLEEDRLMAATNTPQARSNPTLATPFDPELLAEMSADIAELRQQEQDLGSAVIPKSLPEPPPTPISTLPVLQKAQKPLFKAKPAISSFSVAVYPSKADEPLAPAPGEMLAPETAESALPLPAALDARRRLLQVLTPSSGMEYIAPYPDYAALPHAPALAPAPATLEPSVFTVLAVKANNGTENYLLNKETNASLAQLGLQPIAVEAAQAQVSGSTAIESAAPLGPAPAPGPAVMLNTTDAAAIIVANITTTVFATVPSGALDKALAQCSYSAIPWGQCGGSSACPYFLDGACTDNPWPTVCCPPASSFQQACTRINTYYWQCLPSTPLPTDSLSDITIYGTTAINVSFPHVGPDPDVSLVIAAPQTLNLSPPPPVLSPPPPAASPPPPLSQEVIFFPPPLPVVPGPAVAPSPETLNPTAVQPARSGRRRSLMSAFRAVFNGGKEEEGVRRGLLASIAGIVATQRQPKSPPPPPPRKSPPPPPPRRSPPPPPPKRSPPPPPRRSPPPPPVRVIPSPPPPLAPVSPPPSPVGPGLIWSDEFNGVNSPTGVDPDNWSFMDGDGSLWNVPGWGNNELEIYSEQNAQVSNGVLSMSATFDGVNFLSTKLRTFGKRDFVPSVSTPNGIRIEASIQLPVGGQGIWPAFWLLPSDSPTYCSGCGAYGSWPASGEIDVMEAVNDMSTIFGTIHYGGPNHRMSSGYSHGPGQYTGNPLTKGFHTFAVDWSQKAMTFSVDGAPYLTVNCACQNSTVGYCGSTNGWFTGNPGGSQVWGNCAPFDRPFHIILNLAVGGGWPGNPTPATVFPQSMLVDYVRAYRL